MPISREAKAARCRLWVFLGQAGMLDHVAGSACVRVISLRAPEPPPHLLLQAVVRLLQLHTRDLLIAASFKHVAAGEPRDLRPGGARRSGASARDARGCGRLRGRQRGARGGECAARAARGAALPPHCIDVLPCASLCCCAVAWEFTCPRPVVGIMGFCIASAAHAAQQPSTSLAP